MRQHVISVSDCSGVLFTDGLNEASVNLYDLLEHKPPRQCCAAGSDPDMRLYMPLPVSAAADTTDGQQKASSAQQKHSLQSALHRCNLQLDSMELHVLAEDITDIGVDDKPELHKMLQAS